MESTLIDISDTPATHTLYLSLKNRITALAIGVLLLVPVVNAIALMILKYQNSDFLYAPVKQKRSTLPRVPAIPLPAATMIPRKTEALARLQQIEEMSDKERENRFEPNANIMHFNVDAMIQKYAINQNPSALHDFCRWAQVDAEQSNRFRRALQKYTPPHESPAYQIVSDLLSRMHSYFTEKRTSIREGAQNEAALKKQFHAIVAGINDADSNCIDQMSSQLQGMLLDLIAEDCTTTDDQRQLARIQYRAGHELCKYRLQLVKAICARENPKEHHMADLERLVMQQLAEPLGMQGEIFTTGAEYEWCIRNKDDRVNVIANDFLNEYQPLGYLMRELRTPYSNTQQLRTDLIQWTVEHYGILEENSENAMPTDMGRRLSADFDAGTIGPFAEGGEWTPAATCFVLEAANLIMPK